ncbi:CYTH domain-containing protein [Candidatus Woesearchaeota archaeon]|nr:CYTH domain-containing protein [Candidatus Woesearchaeota archaeon]
MNEVEVKILDVDVESISQKIVSLGGAKEFDDHMHAVFYRKDGINKTIRLRREGSRSIFCVKEKNDSSDLMIRDEFEVEVSDFGIMNDIILRLGFIKKVEVNKHRIEYKLENCHVAIDIYDDGKIPPFIEVESDNAEDVYSVVSLLGYSKEDCKPWTGHKLMKYYRELKG